MIPKAYQGKYIYPNDDGSYDYSMYLEATSSNFIIHYSRSWTNYIPIFLKYTNAGCRYSYNGKCIIYYQDVDNPAYQFLFFTNKQLERELIYSSLVSAGGLVYYIYADDINK